MGISLPRFFLFKMWCSGLKLCCMLLASERQSHSRNDDSVHEQINEGKIKEWRHEWSLVCFGLSLPSAYGTQDEPIIMEKELRVSGLASSATSSRPVYPGRGSLKGLHDCWHSPVQRQIRNAPVAPLLSSGGPPCPSLAPQGHRARPDSRGLAALQGVPRHYITSRIYLLSPSQFWVLLQNSHPG